MLLFLPFKMLLFLFYLFIYLFYLFIYLFIYLCTVFVVCLGLLFYRSQVAFCFSIPYSKCGRGPPSYGPEF